MTRYAVQVRGLDGDRYMFAVDPSSDPKAYQPEFYESFDEAVEAAKIWAAEAVRVVCVESLEEAWQEGFVSGETSCYRSEADENPYRYAGLIAPDQTNADLWR